MPRSRSPGPPTAAGTGGIDPKLIACEARPIENDCCACGAAWYAGRARLVGQDRARAGAEQRDGRAGDGADAGARRRTPRT